MRDAGNPHQWGTVYPSEQLLEEDIRKKQLYLCESNGTALGVFCYFFGEDPSYARIENGAWLNSDPYGVVHRIAVSVHGKGVAGLCLAEAFSRCRNLKIDTHKDNLPMQRTLQKCGFIRCGTVYLPNGEARIAYQKAETNGISF